VLNDAGITSLIIDPNPMFVERAQGGCWRRCPVSSRS